MSSVQLEKMTLPESAGDAVEAVLRLDVLVLLVPLVTDLATGLLSSAHEDISQTEWRLMPVPPPAEESTSYSTTGVSMGTL